MQRGQGNLPSFSFCSIVTPMNRIIETERLLLRPLRDDDAEAIMALINDFDISKNLARVPYPYHRSDADEFLSWVKDCTLKSRFSAICLREKPQTLQGCISYEWHEGKQNAELGYWLSKPLWGKGLMSQAAIATVDHAFEVAGINTLASCYFDENPASGKVLQHAGFQMVGACTQFSKAQQRNVAVTNMELTRSTWRNKKAAP
jgi:RimJ/RimL family protein N-acetyltransferase